MRTVEECRDEAAGDITVQTTLLEARLLAGSRTLFGALYDRIHDGLDPQAFFKAKKLEQEQRHAKYQDTPYSLEPNLKEAPGGLRDLQIVLWMRRASGLGRDWRALAARGLVTAGGGASSSSATRTGWRGLRIRLHYLAGRREDRLLFDFQAALAKAFGFAATPTGARAKR